MAEATVRKFVSVKPIVGDSDLEKQIRSLNVAYNRMGGALTGIGSSLQNFAGLVKFHGEFLKDTHERMVEQMKGESSETAQAQRDLLGKERKEKGRKQDEKAEADQEKQKKEGEEAGKKQDKKEFSWLEKFLKPLAPIIGFISSLVKTFIIYNFLDFLSKPQNLDKVVTFLKVIKGIWSFTRKISMWGMNQLLDGITRVFGTNPEKGGLARIFDGMFGVLQIMGGLAGLWAASRLLMPWKLVTDVKFMAGLGKALNMAEKTSGCGPDGKKPRTKGNTLGKDGRTAKERLRDIRKLKRQRKINALNRKIAKAQRVAARNIKQAALNTRSVQAAARRTAARAARQIAEESAKQFAERQAARRAAGLTGEAAEGLTRRAADTVTDVATSGAQATKPKPKSALANFGNWAADRVKDGKNTLTTLKDKAVSVASATWDFGKGQISKLNAWWGKNSKAFMESARQAGAGAWDWGKQQAKKIGDVAALAKDPKKLGALVTDKIKQNLKPVIEKNPQVKQIMEVAKNPGKMKDPLIKMMQKGFKNPGIKSFRDFLNAAKSNAKVGGVDKVVATILALVDYGLFGESPINALLKALGGLLGYTAGFAIGAPFGGVPGFVTGVAGGFAGEWIADRILEQLYKLPGLKNKKDPVAAALFKGSPYANRNIIRDPNAAQPWEANALTAAQGEKPAEMAKGGRVVKGDQKRLPSPLYTTPTDLVQENDIPTDGEGIFKRFASGGLYVFSTAPAGAPKMMGNGKGYKDTYPHHYPKAGGNVRRSGGIPRDYLLSMKSNPASPDAKGDRHPIRAGVTGVVDSVGEGWGAVRVKDPATGKPIFRSGHMTGIKVKVGDKVNPNTVIGTQDSVGMSNGYVHAHIEGDTAAIHNAWLRANIGATSTDTGADIGPSGSNASSPATGAGGETPAAEEAPPQDPFDAAIANLERILNQHLPATKEVPSGWQGEQSPAGSTTPTPASSGPTQADQLNKKTEKLQDLSKKKVKRDKDGTTKTNTEMLMLQQNIIQPSSSSTSQQVYYGSVSPLVLGK